MSESLLRFRDLKARGIINDWVTLKRWSTLATFPPAYISAQALVSGVSPRSRRGSTPDRLDDELTVLDMRALDIIALHDRLSKNGQGCWSKHETMADEIQCNYTNFSKSAKKLLGRGYVTRERSERNGRLWVYRVVYEASDSLVIGDSKRARIVGQGDQQSSEIVGQGDQHIVGQVSPATPSKPPNPSPNRAYKRAFEETTEGTASAGDAYQLEDGGSKSSPGVHSRWEAELPTTPAEEVE